MAKPPRRPPRPAAVPAPSPGVSVVPPPVNDQALYMLAVVHSERRDPELAIRYLAQAIEANPENRSLARVDPDLDALRGAAGFTTLLS